MSRTQSESSSPPVPMLIDGKWFPGAGPAVPLLDKLSLEVIASIPASTREQVAEAVRATAAAFNQSSPSAYERGEVLDKAAAAIEARRPAMAATMLREVGFTATDADTEITRCIQTLRLCAEEARRLSGEMVPIEGSPGQAGRLAMTLRVPLGVVCAITPFNSPLNTLAHKIGPAFAAGNPVLLKPSQFAPLTANLLIEAVLEAGAPSGFFAVVQGGAEVGQWLLEEQDIRFYAFTGSTHVGLAIQRQIGLRRSQMELGSIAHTILDEGAVLERVLPKIVAAAYRKAGQVCTSVQLLLVHAHIFDRVLEQLKQRVQQIMYGDPRTPGCVVGPLISEAAAIRVERGIEQAIAQGATRHVGGPRAGSVVPPTLLTGVTPAMSVCTHEIFGPVLSVLPFDRFEDALVMANSTPYGLSAGVFTDRLDHALEAARVIRAGAVHINETSSSRADAMPFGGTKDSGFGREGPSYAIREMSEEKLITMLP